MPDICKNNEGKTVTMIKICPISLHQINEAVSRLNAAFTFLLVLICLISAHPVLPAIIIIDFIFRNVREGHYNPLIRFNKFIVSSLSISGTLINAGPKIFAARVGLMLSVFGMGMYYFISPDIAMMIYGLLGFFAFMEAFLNYCVACKLYPWFLALNRKLEK